MKKTLFIAIISILSLGSASAQDEKEVKIKTSAICEMCKERIERNLGLSKGVKSADLNLKDKVVTVKYNPGKTNPDNIKATIVKTGYDADNAIADQKAHDKLPSCCRKTASAH